MKKIQSAAFGVPEYDMNRVGTYRPRISPEQLRRLWKMKQESGKPITELVDEKSFGRFLRASVTVTETNDAAHTFALTGYLGQSGPIKY